MKKVVSQLPRPHFPTVLSGVLSGVLAVALSGCTLAPHYVRPTAPVASEWPVTPPSADAAKLKWRDLFTDPGLAKTIDLALANNRDLRVAVLNIDKANATYGIQRAGLLPTLNGTLGESKSQTPASVSSSGATTTSETYTANLGLSAYEVDLFGRMRSLKDVALQSYLATKETRNAVTLSLIAQVATAWLNLAADQDALALSQQTLQTRLDTLNIAKQRAQIGVLSDLDLSSIVVLAQTARADVAKAQTTVDQDKAALTLLVGATVPADLLPAGLKPGQVADGLPVGLPSDVLLDRPDVLSAEHSLISANANIGAARAAFFPKITLTGSTGSASRDLDGLFDSGTHAYSFTPQISVPIFAGGANVLGLKSAKVSRDIALATYEKSIQSAFSEVSTALAVRARIDERLDAQTQATAAAQTSYTLSTARYQNGADSYLTQLDAARTLYTSQQSLITLQALKATNLVALYKAVGHDDSLN